MKSVDDPFPEDDVAVTARDPKNEKRLALRDEDQIVFLMHSPVGRGFVWDQLADAGVYRTSFAAEATHSTAFAEGKREQGLKLLARVMKHAPEFFYTMTQEAQSHEN